MTDTIRTFIAARVTPALLWNSQGTRSALGEVHAELGRHRPDVKPIEAKQLHVTLKFLGDTRVELLPEILDRMREVAELTAAFEWSLKGLGVFPDLRQPKVVWAGLRNDEPAREIAAQLEAAMQQLGFEPERRPFRPHVTLAYVKGTPPQCVFDLINQHAQTDFGQDRVTQLELIESRLLPSGSEYRQLAFFALTSKR